MTYMHNLLVVVGACVLMYAASGFSGSLSGSSDAQNGGSVSGEVSYAQAERLQMTTGAGLIAIGLTMRRRT